MQCYRFDSQEQFRSLAAAEGLICLYEDDNGDEVLITGGHGWALDEVGVISKGGEWDPETGEVITPPTVLDGWHVNVTGDLSPEAWDPYLVVVNHPVRVFAGGASQAPDTPILEEIVAS
jgi:hypothetical protein